MRILSSLTKDIWEKWFTHCRPPRGRPTAVPALLWWLFWGRNHQRRTLIALCARFVAWAHERTALEVRVLCADWSSKTSCKVLNVRKQVKPLKKDPACTVCWAHVRLPFSSLLHIFALFLLLSKGPQETRSQGSRGQQQLVPGSPLILSPRAFFVSNFSVSQEAVPPMLTLVAVIVPLFSEALSLFHCP